MHGTTDIANSNRRALKKLLTIFLLLTLSIGQGYSQCLNQVTHLTGTSLINGVNVSVTSSGIVDTFYTYCPNTFPYFIGADWTVTGGTGSYSFSFSPPIDSLTLNFSGVSNSVTCCQEVVKLFVNGNHYSIPSIGTPNGCDTMALLTPSGDIMGCSYCGVSGWNGTTISGTISSLTVLDSMILGTSTGGALFSLFICASGVNGIINPTSGFENNSYPNPFSNQLTFALSDNEQATISLYDFLGQQILQQLFINSTTINTEQFKDGIYFYQLRNSKRIIANGKVIKN